MGSRRRAGPKAWSYVKAMAALLLPGHPHPPGVVSSKSRPWLFLRLDRVRPGQESSSGPLLLALCLRAVGGAQASLVGRQDRRAPPFQPSLPYQSLGDRRIVLPRGRQLDGARRPPTLSVGARGCASHSGTAGRGPRLSPGRSLNV